MEETEKIISNIRENLSILGLSSPEREVFLLLAGMGEPCPTTAIARELGTRRQTLYSTLQSMKKRKLVTETKHGKNFYFQTDVNHLKQFITSQYEKLLLAQKSIEKIYTRN